MFYLEDGLEKIKVHKPQLVFLDVEFGQKSGFDLLNELDEINFEIIFITGFNQYAVRAFKFAAIDYLLKHLLIKNLSAAIET
ncbi:MAG: response regulator [Bacteroidota bacterium]